MKRLLSTRGQKAQAPRRDAVVVAASSIDVVRQSIKGLDDVPSSCMNTIVSAFESFAAASPLPAQVAALKKFVREVDSVRTRTSDTATSWSIQVEWRPLALAAEAVIVAGASQAVPTTDVREASMLLMQALPRTVASYLEELFHNRVLHDVLRLEPLTSESDWIALHLFDLLTHLWSNDDAAASHRQQDRVSTAAMLQLTARVLARASDAIESPSFSTCIKRHSPSAVIDETDATSTSSFWLAGQSNATWESLVDHIFFLVLRLLSRCSTSIGPILRSILALDKDDDNTPSSAASSASITINDQHYECDARVAVRAIVQQLIRMMLGPKSHSDVVASSALCLYYILSSVTQHASHSEALARDTMTSIFPELCGSGAQGGSGWIDSLLQLDGSHGATFSHLIQRDFTPMMKLALYRGVAISFESETLSLPISWADEHAGLTLLLDCVLPSLYDLCEAKHATAVRVMAFNSIQGLLNKMLQRLGASTDSVSVVLGLPIDKLVHTVLRQLLSLIWRHLESVNDSVEVPAQELLEKLLKLHAALSVRCRLDSNDGELLQSFLDDALLHMLDAEWHSRSKYATLRVVLEQIPAQALLKLRSSFVLELFRAFGDFAMTNRAALLLQQFLASYQKQATIDLGAGASEQAIEEACRGAWLPAFLSSVLDEPSEQLQRGVLIFAVPSIMRVFRTCTVPLVLALYDDGVQSHSALQPDHLTAMLYVIYNARKVGLLTPATLPTVFAGTFGFVVGNTLVTAVAWRSDLSEIGDTDRAPMTTEFLLERGIMHLDATVQLAALHATCTTYAGSELPSRFEMAMVRAFVQRNVKAASSSMRNKSSSLLLKFMWRLRDYSRKLLFENRRIRERQATMQRAADAGTVPQPGELTDAVRKRQAEQQALLAHATEHETMLVAYLDVLGSHLVGSLYPGNAFGRSSMALQLLHDLGLRLWGEKTEFGDSIAAVLPPSTLGIFSDQTALALLFCLWESYDRSRQYLFELLEHYPRLPEALFTAAPSIGSNAERLLRAAVQLLCSSRMRECDTGALYLRLLARQVHRGHDGARLDSLRLPSLLALSGAVEEANAATSQHSSYSSVLSLLEQLLELFAHHVTQGERDILVAAKRTPMHGVLLAIRYVIVDCSFKDERWRSHEHTSLEQWRSFFVRLLKLIDRALLIGMKVVSDIAPEGYNPANNDADDADADANDNDDEDGDGDGGEGGFAHGEGAVFSALGQMVSVCSWLVVKECSLVLGTLTQVLSVGQRECSDESDNDAKRRRAETSSGASSSSAWLLTADDMEWIGERMVALLLSTKHRGALETTYAGFELVCMSLFKSGVQRLVELPSRWIDRLLHSVANPQSVVTRRSAGLPYAFCAILRALRKFGARDESVPAEAPVRRSLGDESEGLQAREWQSFGQVFRALLAMVTLDSIEAHADVYRCVHALNIVRAIIRDKALGAELEAPLFSLAFVTVIRGLRSKSWAIRNSSSMCFTVCLMRLLRTKRERDDHSRKNGTTFAQFFSRCPELHPFLLQQLDATSTQLVQRQRKKLQQQRQQAASGAPHASSEADDDTAVVQTSLFSILVLLSKLYPAASALAESNETHLDAKPFVPLVTRCTGHPDLQVRAACARALVPLIDSSRVLAYLGRLVSSLPSSVARVQHNVVHGLLLQAFHLAHDHLLSTAVPIELNSEFDHLVNATIERLWLLSECQCLPISCVYLDLVQVLLEAPTVHQHYHHTLAASAAEREQLLSRLRWQVVQACRQRLAHAATGPAIQRSATDGSDVHRSQLLERAARVCLDHAVRYPSLYGEHCQHESANQLIGSLAHYRDYEVRLVCLERVQASLARHQRAASGESAVASIDIAATVSQLVSRLRLETDQECCRVLLRLLITLRSSIAGWAPNTTAVVSTPDESPMQLLERLQSIYRTSASVDVRQAALECMGHVLGKLYAAGASGIEQHLVAWVDTIVPFRDNQCHVEARKSAAQSLCFSDLLPLDVSRRSSSTAHAANEAYDELMARLWILALEFLQDDEEDIRAMVAAHISVPLMGVATAATDDAVRQEQWRRLSGAAQATTFSQSLELGFGFLAKYYGARSAAFVRMLQALLFAPEAPAATFPLLGMQAAYDDIDVLFPKEPDNYWEEPIELVELAARFVRECFEHDDGDALWQPQQAAQWRNELWQHLRESLIPELVASHRADASFIGAVDISLSTRLLRRAHALYALSGPTSAARCSSQDREHVREHFEAIVAMLHEFRPADASKPSQHGLALVLHPAVSHALHCVTEQLQLYWHVPRSETPFVALAALPGPAVLTSYEKPPVRS